MFKSISKWLFYDLWGWKVSGEMPSLSKYLIVFAPHTSNWDFLVGLLFRKITDGFYPRYIGKKELFVWPIGYLFRALGGYPVERSKKSNFVNTMVDIYNSNEEFITTISPEGTRKHNSKWKTGFYFIAKNAEIPIVKVGVDYPAKTIQISEPYFITKGVDDTVAEFQAHFRTFKGKRPNQGVL